MTMNELIVAAKNHGYTTDGQGNIFSPQGRKISTFKNPNGYHTFNVRAKSARGMVYVHRFIAFTLFGSKIFENGMEVRHLNGNSSDNRSSNISFGTSSENKQDIPKEIRIQNASTAGKASGVARQKK